MRPKSPFLGQVTLFDLLATLLRAKPILSKINKVKALISTIKITHDWSL